MKQGKSRDSIIIRTSIIGIIANVLLSAFKAFVGIMTNSIAITMDAVNNISDAASSLITIIGTKLAGKEPDKKHPFGYGRIEYFSALIISIIVLYAGITSLTESIKSIINPETPEYTTASLIIVGSAVIVKIVIGRYFVSTGNKVNSASLVASGKDATLDSVISISTLVAAVIYLTAGVSLEPYLAAIISLVIIKAGIDMLRETISRLLGERADADTAREIIETIMEFDEVSGVYDLVLNDYGPESFQGSVHIEVPDTCTANELDELTRQISLTVYQKHNVILTAVSVYSVNTKDAKAIEVREKIKEIVLGNEYVTQMHGFYLNEAAKSIRFDLVVSFDAKDRKLVYGEVLAKAKEAYPEYEFNVVLDTDFVES